MSIPAEAGAGVRLRNPADFVAAVPYLLGFHPADSLVALALSGDGRIGFSMRVDLPPDEATAAVAADVAHRMQRADAARVAVFVYTSVPPSPRTLPFTQLVDDIEAAVGMPLLDALVVDGDRFWSYLCGDPRCCPAAGRTWRGDSSAATAVAALAVAQGDVVLPDRAALVATVAPVGGETATQMQLAIERSWAARSSVPSRRFLRDIDGLCELYAEPPVSLSIDEAASVVVAVHRIAVRDPLLRRLAVGDEPLEQLIREVARARPTSARRADRHAAGGAELPARGRGRRGRGARPRAGQRAALFARVAARRLSLRAGRARGAARDVAARAVTMRARHGTICRCSTRAGADCCGCSRSPASPRATTSTP